MTADKPQTSGKTIFALILGIPLAVIALSTVVYYMANEGVVELGTVNRGTLIEPPVQLAELEPIDEAGNPIAFNRADSLWAFLVVGPGYCDDLCEKRLYLVRQTHTALGKRMGRVHTLYLNTDGAYNAAFADLLSSEHDKMQRGFIDGAAFAAALEPMKVDPLAEDIFYVVDPKGWVMMYYAADNFELDTITALGKDVLKDMKRLLQ